MAVIDSGKPGKLLMLRADMDALPIEETAQVSFRSLNKGVMHACGHDVHTANLLAVGEILKRNEGILERQGQAGIPACGGARSGGRQMIEAGLMEELPDACMALHVTSDQRGKFYVGVGPVTAFPTAVKLWCMEKRPIPQSRRRELTPSILPHRSSWPSTHWYRRT